VGGLDTSSGNDVPTGDAGDAGLPSYDDELDPLTSLGSSDATIAGDDTSRIRVEEAIGQGSVIGRYVILGRLGAGGMGVVYAAYDPELDRKVALKILRATMSGTHDATARTRLMREAQALAKLSHPSVVAVHDVGTMGERVWIAMELVKGQTLAAFIEGQRRPWREVVRLMTEAGEGLWAAHEAGLLHRDFKPDNVMIDAGGRVRVMDFGLARTGNGPGKRTISGLAEPVGPVPLSLRVTGVGSLMGTPGYMAPEQLGEREIDARADQFAFGVSLWQALYGCRPFPGHSVPEVVARVLDGDVEAPPADVRVPGWLRRVVERAMATDPAQRFPSMRALLDALARGRVRGRQRAIVAAVGVVAAAGLLAVGLGRWQHARRVAACEAEGASIHEVWSDEAREQVRASLLATGASQAQATFDHVVPLLDHEAERWADHQTEACIRANVEQQWNAETFDRARWCLVDRRHSLESVVQLLAEADQRTVESAIPAVAGLEPTDVCLHEDALGRAPPPPAQELRPRLAELQRKLAHVAMLHRLGKPSQGLAALEELRGELAELAWGPLMASAGTMESVLLESSGELARAEQVGVAAYLQAARSSAWDVAADAASELGDITGDLLARPDDGRLWIAHAEMAASLAGDPLGLHEADRLGTLANIALRAGAYDEARALNERVLELRRASVGPEHYYVARVLVNIGVVAIVQGGRDEEARRAYEEALPILERTVGPEHPDVAVVLVNLGNIVLSEGDSAEAKALFERAIAIQSAVLSADHPALAMSILNVGVVHRLMGQPEQAFTQVSRAIAMWERTVDPQHPYLGLGYFNLGTIEVAREHPREAMAAYERTVAIYRHHEGVQQYEPDAELALAKLLVAHGGDRARALELARTAREGLLVLGPSRAATLAELDAWISETETTAAP